MFRLIDLLKHREKIENQPAKELRCSHCGVYLKNEQINILNSQTYCDSCYNFLSGSNEDAPTKKMTFITVMGGSYSGEEVYFDQTSKSLIGHHYVWHLDDGQEFIGWFDVSLEEVLKELTSRKSFSIKSEEMKLLYEAFGSEVDSTLERIKNSIIEEG